MANRKDEAPSDQTPGRQPQPNENTALLREVSDDLAEEKLFEQIRKWGPYLLIVAGVLVLGVAAFQFRGAAANRAASEASAEFEDAVAALEAGDAAALGALVDTAPAGYGALAGLRLAATAVAEGDMTEARRRYDEVVRGAPTERLRNYARIRYAYLLVDVDPAGAAFVVSEIEGEPGAFAPFAAEVQGFVAVKNARFEDAESRFEALARDLAAPASMRERAADFAAFARSAAAARETGPSASDVAAALGSGGRSATQTPGTPPPLLAAPSPAVEASAPADTPPVEAEDAPEADQAPDAPVAEDEAPSDAAAGPDAAPDTTSDTATDEAVPADPPSEEDQ